MTLPFVILPAGGFHAEDYPACKGHCDLFKIFQDAPAETSPLERFSDHDPVKVSSPVRHWGSSENGKRSDDPPLPAFNEEVSLCRIGKGIPQDFFQDIQLASAEGTRTFRQAEVGLQAISRW